MSVRLYVPDGAHSNKPAAADFLLQARPVGSRYRSTAAELRVMDKCATFQRIRYRQVNTDLTLYMNFRNG